MFEKITKITGLILGCSMGVMVLFLLGRLVFSNISFVSRPKKCVKGIVYEKRWSLGDNL